MFRSIIMGQFDSLFAGIMSSKKMGGNFASRIPLGHHKFAIKKYFPKEAQKKNQGLIMECDVFALESTTLPYGDIRNEPWFLGSDEFGYEADRSRDFITAVAESLGTEPGDGTQIGEWLVSGGLNGLVLVCDVVQQFQKDGVTPKLTKGKDPIYIRTWSGVPGQSPETIAAVSNAMSQFTPAPQAAPVAAAHQSPAQQNQAAFAAPVQPQQQAASPFQMPTQQAAQPQQSAPTFGGFQAPAATQPLTAPIQASTAPQFTAPAQGAPANMADILKALKK
jgi:hypothetical protein